MKSILSIPVLISVLLLVAALSSMAEADVRPGVRFGGYFDANGVFVGGEVLTDTPWRNWYFNPNVEFAFANHVDVATFNFDVHYDIPVRSGVYVWVGGGPAVLYWNPDQDRAGSETNFAFNVLMGVGFNKGGRVIPYVQPKVILSDHSDFSLAFGVRF